MLCSKHFKEDCFEKEVVIAASLGISRRRKVKPFAVPSIFKKRSIKPDTISGQGVKCCNTDSDDHFSAKKPRAAYEKRERARAGELFLKPVFLFLVFQYFISATQTLQKVLVTELSSPATSTDTKSTSSTMTTDQCDYDCTGSQYSVDVSTQVNITVPKVNARIPVKPKMKSKG